jgi:hypothetical protein
VDTVHISVGFRATRFGVRQDRHFAREMRLAAAVKWYGYA